MPSNKACYKGVEKSNKRWLKSLFICLLASSLLQISSKVNSSEFEILLLDHSGKELQGIVVYLRGNSPILAQDSSQSLLVQQKDKKFVPYIGVVQKKRDIAFINHDDIIHHIYSATGPARFSMKLKAGEKSEGILIEHTGIIPMGCNIHDWMSGYILVLETPYFQLTDETGVARFRDVSPGQYQATVWHPQLRENESLIRQVRLPKTKRLTLQLKNPMANIPQQKSVDDFDFLEDY